MFKRKLKKFAVLSLTLGFIVNGLGTSSVRAESLFSTTTQNEIAKVYDSIPEDMKLSSLANDNIVIYDESGRILNEIHSDGRVYLFEWEEDKIVQVTDSAGYKTTFEHLDNGDVVESNFYNNILQTKRFYDSTNIEINIVEDDQLVEKKRELAEKYSKDLIDASVLNELEKATDDKISLSADTDYYVKGKRMNSLLSSSDFIYNSSKAMTESDIQTFLTNKKSVLKDKIKIYAINSSGKAYDTGRTVKPSTVIYNAAKDEKINPKVILVMLQKESSLVTSTDTNVNRRAFHYAMGYGATDSGDITTYTGFDNQVQLAAKWLYTKWLNDSQMYVYLTVNGGVTKTVNGETYKGEIYVDTYPAWVLYKYTPHVIDYSLLPTIGGGNYLFLKVFEGWWTSWY